VNKFTAKHKIAKIDPSPPSPPQNVHTGSTTSTPCQCGHNKFRKVQSFLHQKVWTSPTADVFYGQPLIKI